jgi:hypothetical protein
MALETPFGNQPGQLAQPVPNATAQPDNPFAAAFENVPQGEIALDPAQAAVPVGVAPEAGNPFAAAFDQEPLAMGGETPGVETPPSDMSQMPPPSGIESVKEQLRETAVRFKNAWTTTDKESVGVLKSSGMFEDVRSKDGQVQVKRTGRKGYENFDRKDFELIGDTLDMARIAFEGVAEAGLEVGGTMLAAGSTGGAGLAAQPAIGAGAAVTAMNFGDVVAEHMVGVERDPQRSRTLENSLAGGLGAGFTWMSGSLARRAAAKQLKKTEAKIGVDAVTESIEKVKESTRELEGAGIQFDKSTSEYVVTPNQATGGQVPELRITEEALSKQPGFRNYVKQRGEELVGAYDTLVGTLNAKSGNVGGEFKGKFKNMGDFFGSEIGRFRQLAQKRIKDPQPMPRVVEHFQGLADELQNVPGGTSVEKLQGLYGLNDNQAKIVIGRMEQIQQKLTNGATPAEVDVMYNSLTKQINNNFGKATSQGIADALIPIKNSLRDDYAEMIGHVLPENQKQAYGQFMKKYSTFKEGEESLRGILKHSDISKKALVSELFEGKYSLEKIKSLKVVMDHEDPKMFRELSSEYFQKLAADTLTSKTGRNLNFNAMARKFGTDGRTGLGSEMQDILLEGAGLTRKQFDSMMHLGQTYQNVDIKSLPVAAKTGVMRSIWNLMPWAGTGGTAKSGAAENLIQHIGKDASMMEYLQEGGAEAFLKKYPNFSPAKQSAFMQWVDNAKVTKAAQAVAPVAGLLKDAAIRESKVGIRQDAQRTGSPGTPMEGQ